MRPDEILVAGEIPIATDEARCGFAELARRRGDYAMIGLAACAPLRGGSFAAPRLVFFAAGDKPVMARHAGAALAGRPNTAEAREAAAQALEQDLDPPSDLNASAEMRLHLAKVLTRRVLKAIAP
jgi:carbon-monoxide dehydrogenase medium subunit